MTPATFDQAFNRRIDMIPDAAAARRKADSLRDDAKLISSVFTHVENEIAMADDRVQSELAGMIESFRLRVLELADHADDRAEDLEDEDRTDAIYGTYDDGVRFDHRVGIGSL